MYVNLLSIRKKFELETAPLWGCFFYEIYLIGDSKLEGEFKLTEIIPQKAHLYPIQNTLKKRY